MSEAVLIPTFEERNAMWRSLDFPRHVAQYKDTEKYAAALRERFANGNVLVHSFVLPSHPVLNWYLERNQFHACNFFEELWSSPTPASWIPYKPYELNYFETSLFEWSSPFQLGGYLSRVLFDGGAYSRSEGYGNQAHLLGEAAAVELLESDYENTLCFHCGSAWSGFFKDVAWDYTMVIISKSRRVIHIILATDTD